MPARKPGIGGPAGGGRLIEAPIVVVLPPLSLELQRARLSSDFELNLGWHLDVEFDAVQKNRIPMLNAVRCLASGTRLVCA